MQQLHMNYDIGINSGRRGTAIALPIRWTKQDGLAVASIARDDPSIGGGHVCWRSHDGFNFVGWCSRCVPGMHRDHNALPSQTDGQTDGL